MSVRDGLVVVVPRGFDRRRIPEILRDGRRWIERTAAKIERQRESLPPHEDIKPPATAGKPDCLALRAIGRECAVEYCPADSERAYVMESAGDRLAVCGKVDNVVTIRNALRRWLRRAAEERLAPRLAEIASEKQFALSGIAVRAQRTRWASCSRKGTINLNVRVLFLPPELVRYIFIHELCHTVHPNHSARFWALVGRHAPDYKAHRARLRDAWRLAPAWLDGA
jgi:predicted metal-dependent hydrolase